MEFLSRNYRMTDFQAALGTSQLKKLDRFISRREEIAKAYNEEFVKVEEITPPHVESNIKHAWHLYTILLSKKLDRNKFFTLMRQENIGVNVHYIPVYRHSFYSSLKQHPKDFPVTEDVFKRTITLPLFPKMSNEDCSDVITSTNQIIGKLKGK